MYSRDKILLGVRCYPWWLSLRKIQFVYKYRRIAILNAANLRLGELAHCIPTTPTQQPENEWNLRVCQWSLDCIKVEEWIFLEKLYVEDVCTHTFTNTFVRLVSPTSACAPVCCWQYLSLGVCEGSSGVKKLCCKAIDVLLLLILRLGLLFPFLCTKVFRSSFFSSFFSLCFCAAAAVLPFVFMNERTGESWRIEDTRVCVCAARIIRVACFLRWTSGLLRQEKVSFFTLPRSSS